VKKTPSKSLPALSWLIAILLTGCLPSNTDNIGSLVTLGLLEEASYILVPFVAQENDYSCGLACLVSVLTYWKDPVSQRELLHQTPPESKATGYKVGELKAIAAGRDKQAFALTATPAFLEQQLGKGRPLIVPLEMEYNHYLFNFMRKIPLYGRVFTYVTDRFVPKFSHFVTVFAVSQKTIWVMDPIFGIKPIPREEFTNMWNAKKRAMLLLAGA
jgi:predicted double-glycine peptidase